MTHEDALARLPELVGLHAAASDDAELAAHLAVCSRCRARLDALRAIDADLRRITTPRAPSARLDSRILAIPGAAGAPERAHGANRRIVAAAACVLLLVAAAAGVLSTRAGGDASPFEAARVVQLVAAHPDEISARIEIGPADGSRMTVRIIAAGLPHGGDRYYGLWLTGANGAVSGGSFRPDGEGECVVTMDLPSGQWTAVDVTEGDRPPSAQSTMASASL